MIHLIIINIALSLLCLLGIKLLWEKMNMFEEMVQFPEIDIEESITDSTGNPNYGVPFTDADAKIINDRIDEL